MKWDDAKKAYVKKLTRDFKGSGSFDRCWPPQ